MTGAAALDDDGAWSRPSPGVVFPTFFAAGRDCIPQLIDVVSARQSSRVHLPHFFFAPWPVASIVSG